MRRGKKGTDMAVTPKAPQNQHAPSTGDNSKAGIWGFFAGVVTAALIAVPLAAAFAFATHPETRFLFANAGDLSAGGYATFWWVATIFLLSLPFLIGYGVAK